MDNLEEEVEIPEEDNSQQEDGDDDEEEEELTPRQKSQIAGSAKEALRLRTLAIEAQVKLASNDASNLLELHEQDPKMANEVAKRFGYNSYAEASKTISGDDDEELEQKKVKSGGLTEDEFNKRYQKMRKQEIHHESLAKAEKMFSKLDEGLQEKAKTYFDKIAGNKILDMETATEFAEMATLYVSKGKIKNDNYTDGLVKLSSTGLSQGSKAGGQSNKKSDYIEVVRHGKLVLIPKTNK